MITKEQLSHAKAEVAALRAALSAKDAELGRAREALERVLDCIAERKLEICIDCVKFASAALSPAAEPTGPCEEKP